MIGRQARSRSYRARHRLHSHLLLQLLVISFAVASLGLQAYAKQELRFLALAYPAQLIDYLNTSVLPQFEIQNNAKVILEEASWDDRMDKILISLAGGVPYDLVVTGYYSPYEEGSIGLLAPLDSYIAGWENANRIVKPAWLASQWQGRTYVVPQNIEIRGIGYNKRLFSESGLNPEAPPQSWDEFLQYVKRLTRMGDNQLTQRGIALSTSVGSSAQYLFWLMRQAGMPEINVQTFESNLNTGQALEALRFFRGVDITSHRGMSGAGGGLEGERVAMAVTQPKSQAGAFNKNPTLASYYGLFAPRKAPDRPAVSHAFVNGLAITAASPNKDLAWKLITTIHEADTLFEIERISGFISGRLDMARRMASIVPHVDLLYDLFNYMQVSVIPPPRNLSQQAVGEVVSSVRGQEISPEEALEKAHATWSRMLKEWQGTLK